MSNGLGDGLAEGDALTEEEGDGDDEAVGVDAGDVDAGDGGVVGVVLADAVATDGAGDDVSCALGELPASSNEPVRADSVGEAVSVDIVVVGVDAAGVDAAGVDAAVGEVEVLGAVVGDVDADGD